MQDCVQEVLKSLEPEWGLGELLSLREGLEVMLCRKNHEADEIREIGCYGDVEEYLRQDRGSWVSPMYEGIRGQIQQFSDEDQNRFLKALDEYTRQETEYKHTQRIEGPQSNVAKEDSGPLYSVLNFEGIARGMWDNVGGIDEFIRQERASWDD